MPAYFAELDDGPVEVRRGYANNAIRFLPKVDGYGNVLVDLGTAPRYSLYTPAGVAIITDQLCTITTPDAAYNLLELTVDASNIETYQLLEFFRADIRWRHSVVPARELLDSVSFSCVREPYRPRLSLNDFIDEVADARQYLLGQAQAIDANRTAEQHASILGVKAWTDVHIELQNILRSQGRIYPRLVIDAVRIQQAVIAQALFRLFRGETSGADHAKVWGDEAQRRIKGIGDLPYDQNDDGVKDTELKAPMSIRLRRSW